MHIARFLTLVLIIYLFRSVSISSSCVVYWQSTTKASYTNIVDVFASLLPNTFILQYISTYTYNIYVYINDYIYVNINDYWVPGLAAVFTSLSCHYFPWLAKPHFIHMWHHGRSAVIPVLLDSHFLYGWKPLKLQYLNLASYL